MSCEEIKLLLEAQRSTGLGFAPLAKKKEVIHRSHNV